MRRLLLIDDDERLGPPLAAFFARFEFELVHATRPGDGLARLRDGGFDAAILDVMLPEMDGFELCRRIRHGSDIPVLMLTARGDVTDRVVGLELGADDYLTKPFSPRELVARVRTLLRRSARSAPPELPRQIGRIAIDLARHVVTVDGGEVECTRGEFAILAAMSEQPDRVFTRAQLLHHTRGIDRSSTARTIDVHVMNLRRKIETDPQRPAHLVTVYGVGYKLAAGPA